MTLKFLLLMSLLVAVSMAGCEDPYPVGDPCRLPSGLAERDVVGVATPALDCVSHMCLYTPAESVASDEVPIGECTAECSSDDDCHAGPNADCEAGFTCAIPVVTGQLCCVSMCICRDQLGLAAGESLPAPAACAADDSANTCCNLAGREGSC